MKTLVFIIVVIGLISTGAMDAEKTAQYLRSVLISLLGGEDAPEEINQLPWTSQPPGITPTTPTLNPTQPQRQGND